MKGITGTAINTGNIAVSEGEKTSISPAAYGVIMDMLSGMYSNAAEAVLREYSVNGWDEHKKYNVGRPVEVTLPSHIQNTLEIRDYGYAGLSADKVMSVFGEYGNSTKRGNDTEAGGFGIGSKAAFALGQQFIVTGYQDGQVFSALFTLNEDGTGTKTVMHEGQTEEQNGVKVTLGVEDVDGMHEAARRFFSFWDRGDVLVDGQEPTPIFETLEKINDEIYIQPNGRGEAFAVMGPVAYPVGRDLLRKVSKYLEKQGLEEAAGLPLRLVDSSTDVYLRVPIGGVIPAPSRESLRDRDKTVNTLGAIFFGLLQDSAVKIQAEVDAAETYWEAISAFERTNSVLGAFKVSRKSVKWKGQPLPGSAAVAMRSYTLVSKSWRSSTQVVGEEAQVTLTHEQAQKTLTIVGVSEDQFGSVRRYVKRFLEETEGIDRVFVTESTAVSHGWFQVGISGGVRSWTLEEWRAHLKTLRKNSPRTVNEPSYTTGFNDASRDLNDRDLLSDILSEGKDLVLFTESARYLNRFQREVLKDYTVVVLLGTQSEDMLRKRVEKAEEGVSIVEWADLAPKAGAAAQAVLDGVTDEEKEALGARTWLSNNSSSRDTVRNVISTLSHAGEVTNKGLLGVEDSYALAEIFAAPMSDARMQEIREARAALGMHHDLSSMAVAYEENVDSVLETLPLLDASDLRRINNSFDRHVQIAEDGEVTIANRGWYHSYDRESYENDMLHLRHALAYVNSH